MIFIDTNLSQFSICLPMDSRSSLTNYPPVVKRGELENSPFMVDLTVKPSIYSGLPIALNDTKWYSQISCCWWTFGVWKCCIPKFDHDFPHEKWLNSNKSCYIGIIPHTNQYWGHSFWSQWSHYTVYFPDFMGIPIFRLMSCSSLDAERQGGGTIFRSVWEVLGKELPWDFWDW